MRKSTLVLSIALSLIAANALLLVGCAPKATQPAASPPVVPSQPSVPAPTPPSPVPSQSSPPSIGLKLVAEGLASPVDLQSAPDSSGRLFVLDQVGLIRIVGPDGKLLAEPFLDLRNEMVALNAGYDERGLLGMAFHPSFKDNGRFFVYYSAPLRVGGSGDHTSHLSEFKVSTADPNRADPDSERIVLQVDEPQANHNGGALAFGPDGFLYISLGDGGAANDVGSGHVPGGNAQDTNTLLGKILRIDVNGAEPYAVPPDNPFAGKDGRDEIFALGFRNPFRFSFDKGGTHELLVGDVGQGLWEEVDIITKGNNYGWNLKEGAHGFNPQDSKRPPAVAPVQDASGRPLIDPIIEYPNAGGGGIGIAVIGGYVYRGQAMPQFQGKYIFGDLSSGFQTPAGSLFIATRPSQAGPMWERQELGISTSADGRLNAFLKAFGQDTDGELYALVSGSIGPSGNSGKVYKLVP